MNESTCTRKCVRRITAKCKYVFSWFSSSLSAASLCDASNAVVLWWLSSITRLHRCVHVQVWMNVAVYIYIHMCAFIQGLRCVLALRSLEHNCLNPPDGLTTRSAFYATKCFFLYISVNVTIFGGNFVLFFHLSLVKSGQL